MLGRQAFRSLFRSATSATRSAAGGYGNGVRTFADAPAATSESSSPSPNEEFIKAWNKVVPNFEPPKTPLAFMKARPAIPGTIPTKVTVNFVLPYQVELNSKEVDMVIIPATTGQMGVLPGHVASIAELKPGVMSVHVGDDVKKYFISSGFAFIHANSFTDIIAVEAVPLDRIDPEQVQKGLAEYTQKVASASTDLEKAEAQIGVELHSALSSALSG
uniref:ATP synthase F1 complex delta/epsilon subunit N-terminal domain-containing protein n=1 Tax=Araucaria cunninghamii TaxID=56994 RepID=A0A0D6R6J7_ARACU